VDWQLLLATLPLEACDFFAHGQVLYEKGQVSKMNSSSSLLIMVSLSKYREAIARYSRAIELNSKVAEYFYGRAKCKVRLGNIESATTDMESAIQIKPWQALLKEEKSKMEAELLKSKAK
jgi:tetratricopeptide (TPR) repeat protein